MEQTLRSAGRTATTFAIPNILRQVDTIFDPKVYKPEDIQECFSNPYRSPGAPGSQP